ncbi:hypothetical protein PMAYCL1PPCAC_16226, partial [Pristionchus mayeri]
SLSSLDAQALVAARQIDARPKVLAYRWIALAFVHVFKTVFSLPPLAARACIRAETIEAFRVLVLNNTLVWIQDAIDCGIPRAIVGTIGAVLSVGAEDAVTFVRSDGVGASGLVDTRGLPIDSLNALVQTSITVGSRRAGAALAPIRVNPVDAHCAFVCKIAEIRVGVVVGAQVAHVAVVRIWFVPLASLLCFDYFRL